MCAIPVRVKLIHGGSWLDVNRGRVVDGDERSFVVAVWVRKSAKSFRRSVGG